MPGRLVAAGDGDQAVEALGVHHQLHRVGDHLPADQRGPHALVPHGDGVGHGDGVEGQRHRPGQPDPVLGVHGQAVEVDVAGVTSFQDDATPTWGRSKSSSVKPTARSMERAGAGPARR